MPLKDSRFIEDSHGWINRVKQRPKNQKFHKTGVKAKPNNPKIK